MVCRPCQHLIWLSFDLTNLSRKRKPKLHFDFVGILLPISVLCYYQKYDKLRSQGKWFYSSKYFHPQTYFISILKKIVLMLNVREIQQTWAPKLIALMASKL